jgi:parvulin-like peptidyl-prolyl isomerase
MIKNKMKIKTPPKTAPGRLTRRWLLLDWRQLMKIFCFVPILALALCPGPRLHAEMVDGVLAVVNDTVITRQQVEEFIAPAIDSLRREYAGQPEAVVQQKLTGVINDGLDQLVERQLILHEFNTLGYRMPDSYLDQIVQDRIRDQFYGDRVTLMKTLQAQGETFESFREGVRDQAIETFMRSKNVAQEIVVSPYKIENYYNAHQADYKVADEIKLRMIVLNKTASDDTNTVKLAREIRDQIKAGAAFEQMASIHSQDSLRSQGGDWGWIDRSVLREELADAAFALKPGQVSDVIEMPKTCYLMLVEQTRPAHVKPLNEVRDEIEKNLRAQEQARLLKQWIARLKTKSFILRFP